MPEEAHPVEAGEGHGVAGRLHDLLVDLFGAAPAVTIAAWDGSRAGGPDDVTVHVRSRKAVRRLLWQPGAPGFAHAYVTAELDIEGDLDAAVSLLRDYEHDVSHHPPIGPAGRREVLRTTVLLGAVGPAPRAPSDPLDAVAGYSAVDAELRLLLPDELAEAIVGPSAASREGQCSEVYLTYPEPLSALVARWEADGVRLRELRDATAEHLAAVTRWAERFDACAEEVVDVVGERQSRSWRLSLALDGDNLERGRVRAYRAVGDEGLGPDPDN